MSLYQRIMQRMEYRFNFLLVFVSVSLQVGLYLIFLGVIFNYIDNLAGWSYQGALLIVAAYMIVEGVMWALVAHLVGVNYMVRTGDLDIVITKPVNTQFLVSINRGDPEDWARVLIGLIVVGFAFSKFDLAWGQLMTNGLLYFYFVFFAVILVYSLTLLVRTIAFWFVEGKGMWVLLDSLMHLGQFPVDIFHHKIVRFFLTFIVPIAFIGTVPAQVFREDFVWIYIIIAPILAIIFFFLSKRFWEYGLSKYSSASS